jgi:hypothetical protein
MLVCKALKRKGVSSWENFLHSRFGIASIEGHHILFLNKNIFILQVFENII